MSIIILRPLIGIHHCRKAGNRDKTNKVELIILIIIIGQLHGKGLRLNRCETIIYGTLDKTKLCNNANRGSYIRMFQVVVRQPR